MPSIVPDSMPGSGQAPFPDYADYLHVAAAVIENPAGEILLARRADHLHQGGLWEFPGGKVESGESARDALARELEEELGITVRHATPLIRIPYHYPDRKVLLDIWRVSDFGNSAHGAEGQAITWVSPGELADYEFPAANLPIVTAARLPHRYLITPEPGGPAQWPAFLHQMERAVTRGLRLVQLRAKALDSHQYAQLAREVISLGSALGAQVLLNASPAEAEALGADGVHLTSARLMALQKRPLGHDAWVAASCHTLAELRHAMAIGVDFVVASPVKVTASHPKVAAIGWEGFRLLTEHATVPVFALGGMENEDLPQAWENGGQGIAAIRALWS